MDSGSGRQRILLAGPTLLYLPVYLAWINSNESIKERVRFWSPPAIRNPKRKPFWSAILASIASPLSARAATPNRTAATNGQLPDPLIRELFESTRNQDVLFCVGDPLRAFDYDRAKWDEGSICASLINKLPVRAYTIAEGPDTEPPIYLCHYKNMSTWEIAQYINGGREDNIFGDVDPGFENVYVDSAIEAIKIAKSRGDSPRKVVFVGTDTLIPAAFAEHLIEDEGRTNAIYNLHQNSRFMLTAILKVPDERSRRNEALRADFIGRIQKECDKLCRDPQLSAIVLFNGLKSLNRFHNVNLNELTEICERLSRFYSVDRPNRPGTGTKVYDGISAAGKVRFNHQCRNVRKTCRDCRAGPEACQKIFAARKPFARIDA